MLLQLPRDKSPAVERMLAKSFTHKVAEHIEEYSGQFISEGHAETVMEDIGKQMGSLSTMLLQVSRMLCDVFGVRNCGSDPIEKVSAVADDYIRMFMDIVRYDLRRALQAHVVRREEQGGRIEG
jgi:hypothetical protein